MHSGLIFKQENPSLEAQVEGTPTILPTYIRVRAVVWECGEGHTHTHTHKRTDARDQSTFRFSYASRET